VSGLRGPTIEPSSSVCVAEARTRLSIAFESVRLYIFDHGPVTVAVREKPRQARWELMKAYAVGTRIPELDGGFSVFGLDYRACKFASVGQLPLSERPADLWIVGDIV